MTRPGTSPAPQDHEAVGDIVAEHLPRFGQVLTDAWGAFAATRRQAAPHMAFASTSSRGMLVSDFTCEPARRIFASVPDAWVDDRYGRPWVNLADGSVQVRFRKLTPELALCRSDSVRATSLAYHLGDPVLPGMEPATILTAGYVLDLAEQGVERLALVCHVGTEVYYFLPIPAAASSNLADSSASSVSTASTDVQEHWREPESAPGPVQLPLTPLSRPIIRSAQNAARKRLHLVGGQINGQKGSPRAAADGAAARRTGPFEDDGA